MKRHTFMSDGYYAINGEENFDDQDENYCGAAINKLAEYEDAEEQGRLLVLPCKVENILYITEPRFYNYKKHEGIQKGVCKGYELNDRWGWSVKVKLDEGEPHTLYFYNFSQFGETVFLTYEEAEASLNNN